MAVSHTRVAVSPLGRAKWWLRDGKVEAMDSPITYANADAQGIQDLSVEGGGKFYEKKYFAKTHHHPFPLYKGIPKDLGRDVRSF
jgi:hypothetical protein